MNPSLCDGSCNAKVKIPSSIVVDEEEEPVDNQPQGGFYEEEHLWWFQVSRNLTWKEGNLSFERLKDIYSVYMYTIYQWLYNSFPASPSSFYGDYGPLQSPRCKTYEACNGRWLFKVICGCETKTPHPWGAGVFLTVAEYLLSWTILWSWLVSSKHIL